MSQCKQCGAPISFNTVMSSLSPYKLNCKSCKAPIKINTIAATIALLIALASAFFIYSEFKTMENFWLYVVLPLVIGLEVIFYLLIKANIVKVKTE